MVLQFEAVTPGRQAKYMTLIYHKQVPDKVLQAGSRIFQVHKFTFHSHRHSLGVLRVQ